MSEISTFTEAAALLKRWSAAVEKRDGGVCSLWLRVDEECQFHAHSERIVGERTVTMVVHDRDLDIVVNALAQHLAVTVPGPRPPSRHD